MTTTTTGTAQAPARATTADLELREAARPPLPRPGRPDGSRRRGHHARRAWAVTAVVAVGAAVAAAGVGSGQVLNPAGATVLGRFLQAASSPDLSPAFLRVVGSSTLVTLGYALLGTLLAVVIGLVGGVLTSQTWWRRDVQARTRRLAGGWLPIRVLAAVPRGLHEAVWALLLLRILGRDPLVAVLAIAIPFGAITAKVVAELIDDAGQQVYAALRVAGAGRIAALSHSLVPQVSGDVLTYAFYRFECALRSSVVLGMVGVGGLGFQLALSLQSLRYDQIWTLLYALILLGAAVDGWGARLRRRPTRRAVRCTAAVVVAGVMASGWWLQLDPAGLVSDRSARFAADLLASAWPPRLPAGGWPALAGAVADTLVLSLVAMGLAVGAGLLLALVAARRDGTSPARRALGGLARAVLLTARAIPPPAWALLVLFVVLPGPLPGGIALGLYTAGVLGRLYAEQIENHDRRAGEALRMAGAPAAAVLGYATLPAVAPGLVSAGLYRWEVSIRETVVVGLVGAGGLGRLLAEQQVAFDDRALLTTLASLVLLSLAVDLLSARIRRDVR